MSSFKMLSLLWIGLVLGCASPAVAQNPSPWKLVWSDEFEGTTLDRTKWDFDIGNGFFSGEPKVWVGGWGNDELEYYTNRPENLFVKDGAVHIRARKESFEGLQYTSSRLKTRKADKTALFAQTYGRFEFRAKLPTGQGVWPALWLLPLQDKYGGWAASGEIDIMEAKGQTPDTVWGTLHFGSGWPHNTHKGESWTLPKKGRIDEFHIYSLEWEPGEMRWYVDGQLGLTQRFWWSSSKRSGGDGGKPIKLADLNPWPAPFDQRFYIVMNVAVGGQFLGNPDASTNFPAEMIVDYVRVYERAGGYPPLRPRGPGKLPFDKLN